MPDAFLAALGFTWPDWYGSAECRRHQNVDFLAERSALQVEHARAICGRCPVAAECLALALADDTLEGVWGDTTSVERRRLRRRAKRPA